MKRFVFPKYLKFMPSISEWSSSIYTFNKRNLFLLNNNEKKAYSLLYHYFSSNLSYNKPTVNLELKLKHIDLSVIYNNSKYILGELVKSLYIFFSEYSKNLLFFSDNYNIENEKILIKKSWRLSRLLKYRLRRKSYLKSFKNRSVNKVYVSKPEIKHSIKEVIITVYVYNRERFYILKKLSKLTKRNFLKMRKNNKDSYKKFLLKHLSILIKKKFFLKKENESLAKFILAKIIWELHSPFASKNFKSIWYNIILQLDKFTLHFRDNENMYTNYDTKSVVPELNNTHICYKFDSNKYVLNNMKKIFYMNLKKVFICKFYIGIIYLTNYKFSINNMTELKNKLYKIYNKKININIINLKYLYLENTIFLDAIMNKLNDRKNKALRVIRKGLGLAKIVKLHPLFYRVRETEKNDSDKEFNKIDDILNNLLFKLKKSKYINIISRLKNKHVSGLRVEAKGRLTKRLTASRAVYKISYKGSLKNIYSSYNKLSTIILRGLSKSNTEYVNTNSKNRNGSYGVKYWISTY